MDLIARITQWFRGGAAEPVATAPPGPVDAGPGGEAERETSTDAQVAGASDEPWPGNE
jgi:hypothetical protein